MTILLQFFIFIILNTCIKLAPTKLPSLDKNLPSITFNDAQIIELGDSRCTYGGTRFTSWKDQGQADGIYTEGQDTDFSEKILCLTLPTGNTAIVTKPGDFKVVATDVAVGDTDCPQGGKRYESFIDVDGNSTYDRH